MGIKSFEAFGKYPQIADCLLALSDAACSLEFASLNASSQAVINSLGTFTLLTTCFLDDSLCASDSDLSPLETLETLTNLQLSHGFYANVNAARHLTSTHLHDVHVTSSSDCSFCSSLLDLQLSNFDIVDIHARGVCACTALKSLGVSYDWCIDSEDRSDLLSTSVELRASTNMSRLTALTRLNLAFDSCEQQADFAGISMLANLEALSLFAYGNLRLNQEFEALTKLTSLSVYAELGAVSCPQQGRVDLSLRWESLQALQSLHVLFPFIWDASVLGLAKLENLQVANFTHANPEDLLSAGSVEVLPTLKFTFTAKQTSALVFGSD